MAEFKEGALFTKNPNREGKAYLVLLACSLTRAVHLELVPNLETESFIPCLKRFIARRADQGRSTQTTGRRLPKLLNGFVNYDKTSACRVS